MIANFRNWLVFNFRLQWDWFDFEWYVRKGCSMNLSHFIVRAKQSGHLKADSLTDEEFRNLLEKRIKALDVAEAVKDVSRFVKDSNALKIWSKDYFHDLARHIQITA